MSIKPAPIDPDEALALLVDKARVCRESTGPQFTIHVGTRFNSRSFLVYMPPPFNSGSLAKNALKQHLRKERLPTAGIIIKEVL